MPDDDPLPAFEQPRSMFSTWIGVVLLFAFFALLVWVVIGATPRGNSYEEKRAQARAGKLKTASEEAAAALTKYGWVDKEKGVARLPIHRAMELSVAELAQKKPAPAGPIATPAVPPAPPAAAQTGAPVSPAPQPDSTPKATTVKGPDSENRNQPAAAANPPAAPPGTQPGPEATPAASPPAGPNQPQPEADEPEATPVQSPPGTPLPVRGKNPP